MAAASTAGLATIRDSLPLGLEGRNPLPNPRLSRYDSITGLRTQLCSTIMDWVTAVWAMLIGACVAMAVPHHLVGRMLRANPPNANSAFENLKLSRT